MWFFISQLYFVVVDYLALRVNDVLRWSTIGNLSIFLYQIANNANVPGLVWANLAFIATLIFHAGISTNRIKNLEQRVQDVENERASVKLASLETSINHLEERLNSVHKSVHDLRNDIHRSGILRREDREG